MNKWSSIGFITLLSAVLVGLSIFVISSAYRGDTRLLQAVSLSNERITPNADGTEDATRIDYRIERNATVSIYLERDSGDRFYFRREQLRGAGQYQVNFSGVVDGYRLPTDQFEGEVLARLLPDGTYTLVISATDVAGVTDQNTLPLLIAEGDAQLPDLRGFEIVPTSFSADWSPPAPVPFTPNRDGIGDRLAIRFDLAKDVDQLRVYLLTAQNVEYPIFEVPQETGANKAGVHLFDYAAGVDQGALPPPDGIYTITAYAEDAEGQKVTISRLVDLQLGGVPRAEIVSPVSADTLQLSATTLKLCDTLFFTMTVRNYGDVPIRTTGPEPGTRYDSTSNYNSLGWNTESGAWRVAIGYENELKDYGYRWAIGRREELTQIGDNFYLMPNQQSVITGSIRIVEPLGERNPQPIWAGLIHEDVEISQFNNRVGIKMLTIDLPDQPQSCPPQ